MGIKKTPAVAETVIRVTHEGNWLPAEQLRTVALSALNTKGRLILNLQEVDHLDADALQILLALARERKKQGGALTLAEVSTSLARWFEYAGARDISPEHVA
jgi:anti-anti-sigma factor